MGDIQPPVRIIVAESQLMDVLPAVRTALPSFGRFGFLSSGRVPLVQYADWLNTIKSVAQH